MPVNKLLYVSAGTLLVAWMCDEPQAMPDADERANAATLVAAQALANKKIDPAPTPAPPRIQVPTVPAAPGNCPGGVCPLPQYHPKPTYYYPSRRIWRR